MAYFARRRLLEALASGEWTSVHVVAERVYGSRKSTPGTAHALSLYTRLGLVEWRLSGDSEYRLTDAGRAEIRQGDTR